MEWLFIGLLLALVSVILGTLNGLRRAVRLAPPPPPPPAQTVRPPSVLGANPYGLPTGAPVLPWTVSTAGHLSTTAADARPADGDIGSWHGEPHRLHILPDGRIVGVPLRTDEVIPVTGGTQLLPRACTVCGEALAPDAVYCVSCGQAVAAMAFA